MSRIPGAPSSRPPPLGAKRLTPVPSALAPPTPAPSSGPARFAEQAQSGLVRKATLPASLVLLALDAPIEEGPSATGEFLVRELTALMPNLLAGLCLDLPQPGGGEPIRWSTVAVSGSSSLAEANGAWLLGAPERELILELPAAKGTLHLARRESHATPTTLLGFPAEEHEEEFRYLVVRVVDRCLELSRRHAQLLEDAERRTAQMMQADRLAAVGQVTTSVLHELNNPLTSILAYTEWLRRRAEKRGAAGEPVDEELMQLGRISEAAEHIAQFTSELVRHARPSEGPGGALPVQVALVEVLQKALGFCEHERRRHGVELEHRLEESTPSVRGVPRQLVQVFVNLVTNAIHAAAEGKGKLLVEAQRDGAWGLVRVTDGGPGIAPDHIDKIFEPFFTTKPEDQGTGLGLAIVRELVSRHGGEISVENVPGGGARFTVRLPVA